MKKFFVLIKKLSLFLFEYIVPLPISQYGGISLLNLRIKEGKSKELSSFLKWKMIFICPIYGYDSTRSVSYRESEHSKQNRQ